MDVASADLSDPHVLDKLTDANRGFYTKNRAARSPTHGLPTILRGMRQRGDILS